LIRKARAKKKGRVKKVTRPKPTIYGNCDSWNFIVGKTRRAYSLGVTPALPLQVRNSHLVHRFSTILEWLRGDNMWASCGSAVDRPAGIPHGGGAASRYALNRRCPDQILPNPVLNPARKLADANLNGFPTVHLKTFAACLFLTIAKKSPTPSKGYGAGPVVLSGQPRAGRISR
jgi:hypothetical protein